MTIKSQRLLEIDGMRGIAALSVVIYHYTHRFDELYGHQFHIPDWLHYGNAGVTLFFMISGFVIYWSISDCKYPLDFAYSRFSRLYPTYWVAVILTFAAINLIGLPGREVSTPRFLVNLSMLQGFAGVSHVDGVYWTLSLELSLYFWVLVIFSIGQLNCIEYWLITWMLVAYTIDASDTHHSLDAAMRNIFIIKYIEIFSLGILLYKIHAKISNWTTYIAVSIALILAFMRLPLIDAFVTLGLGIFFWCGVSGRARWLRVKPLVRLGLISYPLYLIHQNIGYILMRAGYTFGLHPSINISLTLIIAILLSEVIHHMIEVPSKDALVNYYKNSKKCRSLAKVLSPKEL